MAKNDNLSPIQEYLANNGATKCPEVDDQGRQLFSGKIVNLEVTKANTRLATLQQDNGEEVQFWYYVADEDKITLGKTYQNIPLTNKYNQGAKGVKRLFDTIPGEGNLKFGSIEP